MKTELKEPLDFINDDFSAFEDYLKAFNQGTILRKPGEYVSELDGIFKRYYYIVSGSIRSTYTYKTGHSRTVLSAYKKGAIFPLYCPEENSLGLYTTLTAKENVTLWTFSPEVMDHCLNSNPAFNRAMYQCYNRMMNQLLCELSDHIFLPGMKILCSFLLKSYAQAHQNTLYFTQEELSSFIGITRSNVANYLRILKDEKAIETARNKIIIKNIKIVEEYLGD
ncbi:MAG: Crp/Fnr family transcriptional regulator [Eubacterium sp.]|nr:Crp/Fnr family transcriptional regulator [Eubacterium sp.]